MGNNYLFLIGTACGRYSYAPDLPEMKCAVPGSARYNFEATETPEPFKDLNFGLLTVRTSFVYRFCSTRHLRNI